MRLGLVISWVALLVSALLAWTGAISPDTQLLINMLVVGYGLGHVHALYGEQRRDVARSVAMLSTLVDQMGSALASGELSDEERAALQSQRQAVLATLALTERRSLGQRLRALLRR